MTNTPLFNPPSRERRRLDSWKVLIVDDEQGIHDVTKLALKRFVFQNKPLSFYHAYSGNEACEIMQQNPDMALILLDVVMEQDDAGLNTARYIREDLGNHFVRIVLRTGQPGAAPEEQVIRDYDINDYKDKTELTIQKLNTMMYSSLRSYRDLQALEQHRIGLNQVIESTADLFQNYKFQDFVSGLLVQIASIMGYNNDVLMASTHDHSILLAGFPEVHDDTSQPTILSGTGRFGEVVGQPISYVLRDDDMDIIRKSVDQQQTMVENNKACFYFQNHRGDYGLVYLTGVDEIDNVNRDLMQLFTQNMSIAYDNISLYQEIDDTQREVLLRLGNIAEFRSRETSLHVSRVASYSELLALKAGIDEDEARLVRMASPMHDIGKLAIPDNILKKPGKLTSDEYEIMKDHCRIGYEMLESSDRPLLKTAAIIALEHQEKWDGSGYPRGLKGEEIHIYGRITALMDVFDALGSERCYKDAWPLEQVIELIQEQSGVHFDPNLVNLFLGNLDEFIEIRDQLADN